MDKTVPELERPSFQWSAADAYLFDIDGTLLNTRDGVHYFAFRNAVRNIFGVEGSIDGVPVHGNTDLGILRAVLRRQGFPDVEFERKLPSLMAHMCQEVQRNAGDIRVELCPSVADLLRSLHAAGKLLGIVSGNLKPIGWAKIEAAGLRSYFAFGEFSDRNEQREHIFRHGVQEVHRRLGDSASIIIIGDTPSDVLAARRIGVPIVAVATGIFSAVELAELGPDLCVASCAELLATA
jgi:phosphoglycolate phosphatase-like HAD superfamily hydrolase